MTAPDTQDECAPSSQGRQDASPRDAFISRRRSLRVLACWAAAPLVAACGADDPRPDAGITDDAATDDAGARCVTGAPADPERWVEVPLSSLPELTLGGAARFDDGPALVHVWLLDDGDGCYRAVWRICTHGACEVVPGAARRELVCPCHGSRFARDGAVLEGPATLPLRVLEVQRAGASLWVRRPF